MKKSYCQIILVFCLVLSFTTVISQAQTGINRPARIEGRLDRELLPAFQSSRPLDFAQVGIRPFREYFAGLVNSPNLASDAAVKVFNVSIPRSAGREHLRLRVYQPAVKKADMPGIYWLHGGGFLFGVPEQDEAQSIRFAKELGAVVIAPDYRLAPEHPFPAALNDSYDGLLWFAENAADLGVDEKRIAIAGASAGGNLCASLALLARDKGLPKVAFQMPLYPMLDDRFNTAASHEEIDSRVWNNTANRYAWHAYLGELFDTAQVTAYMAPARAQDLSGLPPAYTCVGNIDPFRDDTIRYVARLAQASVPVEFHLYPGAYHAFEVIAPEAAISKQAVDEYVRVLQKALQPLH